ncbi:MAG: hypothetical protein CEE38_04180 [Planctomycetes bacterium B3_Pla]|nr:MAG: hypothetical protein CEE38_04180 [Planctomycetes bacterium B3_Pla]
MRLFKITILAIFSVAILVISTHAFTAGGSGGHATDRYRGVFPDPNGEPEVKFEARLDPLSFLLNRIQNKYKLVRIFVTSRERRIKLSAEDDRIEFRFRNGEGEKVVVLGILNPFVSDPNFWDSLDNQLRRVLAYPKSIKPNEPEVICVLIPAAKVEALRKPEQRLDILPVLIQYKIVDLANEPVEIRREMLEMAI